MEKQIILSELVYKTSRSSGSGGQHVNKTSTKVEVHFDVHASKGLDESEKQRIASRLRNRITNAGTLIVKSQATRSQLKNKTLATQGLLKLLRKGLYVRPPRKVKKVPKSVVEKRLREKKRRGERKAMRRGSKGTYGIDLAF